MPRAFPGRKSANFLSRDTGNAFPNNIGSESQTRRLYQPQAGANLAGVFRDTMDSESVQ